MENLKQLSEISEKFKIPMSTLYHWIYKGKLKSVKIGRKHYIQETDLLNITNKLGA